MHVHVCICVHEVHANSTYTGVWKPEVDVRSLPLSLSTLLLLCLFIVLYGVGTHVLWCMCGGQRTVCGSQFSPSAMWVHGIKSACLQLSLPTQLSRHTLNLVF